MENLRLLAIKAARSILDEEEENPGSQSLDTVDLAREFLTMIGNVQPSAESGHLTPSSN
jgi:hypothetical protein